MLLCTKHGSIGSRKRRITPFAWISLPFIPFFPPGRHIVFIGRICWRFFHLISSRGQTAELICIWAVLHVHRVTGIGMDGGGCCRWLLLLLLFDIGMRVNSIKRGFSSNWTPIYLISLSDIYGDILVQGMCSVQRVYMHLWYVNLFAARLRPNRFPRKSNEDGIPEYSMAEVGCRSSELQRCVIHSLRGVPD